MLTSTATCSCRVSILFFFQAEDGIRDYKVTGVQTCALPISTRGTGGAQDQDTEEGPLPHRGCRPPREARGGRRVAPQGVSHCSPAPERWVKALDSCPSLRAQARNSSRDAEGAARLPCLASLAFTSGSSRALVLASNSFLATSSGRPAGANSPNQKV